MGLQKELFKILWPYGELSTEDINKVLDLIRQVKNQKLDINLRNEYKDLLLVLAAHKGKKEIVEALIEAGADVDLQNKNELTALMTSVMGTHNKIVDTLIKAGANVDLQDNQGNTALIWAIRINNNIEAVKILIEAGANVDLQDYDRWTALMWVSQDEIYKEILDALIEAGANIDLKNDSGDTALIIAVKCKNLEAVFKLTIFSNDRMIQYAKDKLEQVHDILENPHRYIQQYKENIIDIIFDLELKLYEYKEQRKIDIQYSPSKENELKTINGVYRKALGYLDKFLQKLEKEEKSEEELKELIKELRDIREAFMQKPPIALGVTQEVNRFDDGANESLGDMIAQLRGTKREEQARRIQDRREGIGLSID